MNAYAEIGGAKVGRNWWFGFYGTWPFAKLTVTSEGLRLRLLWLVYEFAKSDVLALEVRRGVLGVHEIRIRHQITKYPRLILFWSYGFGRLRQSLHQMGYALT